MRGCWLLAATTKGFIRTIFKLMRFRLVHSLILSNSIMNGGFASERF